MEYREILTQEELLWHQKSKGKRVKYGDYNTHYFHGQTVKRRCRNRITDLFIDDMWCIDDEVLVQEAQLFHKKLFGSIKVYSDQVLQFQSIPQLYTKVCWTLLRPITKEEVSNALSSMDSFRECLVDRMYLYS